MTRQKQAHVICRSDVSVIIICHNLVSDLVKVVSWLEQTGHERLVLLDNASTYPPLLSYMDNSPHRVVRLKQNLGHQSALDERARGRTRLVAAFRGH